MVEKSLKVSLEVWDSAKKFAVSHNDTLQNFVETAIKEKISRENAIHLAAKEEPKAQPQTEQPQADSLPKTEPVKKPEKTVEEEDPYAELKKALNEK